MPEQAYGASGKVAGSCPRRAHRTWERPAAAGLLKLVQALFRAARNATRQVTGPVMTVTPIT